MLYQSLKQGTAKFVEFSLTYGIDLEGFLGKDMECLKKLYETVCMCVRKYETRLVIQWT